MMNILLNSCLCSTKAKDTDPGSQGRKVNRFHEQSVEKGASREALGGTQLLLDFGWLATIVIKFLSLKHEEVAVVHVCL